jgi:hypothetical protein
VCLRHARGRWQPHNLLVGLKHPAQHAQHLAICWPYNGCLAGDATCPVCECLCRLIDTPGLVEAAAEELLQRLPSMNLDQQARTLQVSVKMRIRHAALLGAAAEHLSRQLQHLLGRKQAMQTAASSGSSSSSTYSGLPGHGSTSGVPGGAAGAEQDRSGGWQWEGQQCNPQQQQDAEERIWEELLPQRRLSLLVAALRHLRMAGYPHNPLYQLAAEVLVTSGSLARLAPIEVGTLTGQTCVMSM